MSRHRVATEPTMMNDLFTPKMKRRIWLSKPENDGLLTHHARKRQTAKIGRLPRWADIDAISAVYRDATRTTKETGIRHHVDHVFPLQGKTVCGLHVHQNLRIIPAATNQEKHSKLPDDSEAWPDTRKLAPAQPLVVAKEPGRYRSMFPNSIVRARRYR